MSKLFEMEEVQQETKSNEWYTPARYIEAARAVMGDIELDPASSDIANETVGAANYYTKEQNGLVRDWTCKTMWINPPYGSVNGKSNMQIWSARLIEEHKRGNVAQAVLLCMSNTEASWFQQLWGYPICFPCPRVMFHRPDGSMDHHIQGTCFIYFGQNEQFFAHVFSEFGPVVLPSGVHRRLQPVQQPTLFDQEAV